MFKNYVYVGDSDSDMNDSESIPGSEASSTTASIHDHNFYMPGFDDNEGISTSGQVGLIFARWPVSPFVTLLRKSVFWLLIKIEF